MTLICDSGQGRKKQTRDEIIAPLRANTGAGHNNAVIHSTWPRSSTTNKGGTGHLQRNDGYTYCTDPNNHMAVEMHGLIRRLTPTECELLQGFPRDWTAGVADTNRYKCLGNSVTVPVVADIMEKILK